MGRRPGRCYRYYGSRPYPKSRFNRGVPDPRLQRYETGIKSAAPEDLPICVKLINMEHQYISAEALEAARVSANRYVLKMAGKDGYHLRINLHPFHVLRINKMLSTAGADRLQTGMRHAFGKPYGSVSRSDFNQCILSIRVAQNNVKHAVEAIRRASFKFPGENKIVISNKVGFCNLTFPEFKALKEANLLKRNGNHAIRLYRRGPIPSQ